MTRVLLLPIRGLLTLAVAGLCAAPLTTAGGCVGGGSSARRIYYSLSALTNDQARRYEQPRHPVSIRVRRFESALAYDRQELVYRANPYELQYDWFRLWAAKPAKMLHELMASYLRQTNIAVHVTEEIGDRLPDFEMSCDIHAIEELDANATAWYAHLEMHCVLTRFSDNAIVWEGSFDEKRPVYERQPIFVVRAISDIYSEQLVKIADELELVLVAQRSGPPPSTGAQVPDTPPAASIDGVAADDAIPHMPDAPAARLKSKKK